ncbi:putative ribonuclease H-like domain-containing protein [Tanacetum coccineum]
MTHLSPKMNMVPKAVLMRFDLVSLTTARPVNTAQPKTTMNSQPKVVLNAIKGNHVNAVKASACWVWKPKTKVLDHDSKHNSASITLKKFDYVDAQDLQDQGVIDSGCSRHMTENMSYRINFEDIDGGYVAFGGNPKGGKITGRGTIKTGNLDFENVYFVIELQFNIFSVSQMCDKKYIVLFNYTECIVISPNFKLTDESHVLLKVPRKNNMYSVDLKNIVPKGGLTCLFAKATSNESKLWHRRLGHINFKTMNKLVKGNLVRSLPLKLFENDQTRVACQKGKQHRSSYDYYRFSWVFFLATKNETSGILKSFITGVENLIDQRVKVIRCDNGTEFKNKEMNQFCKRKGIKREFSVARTSQQNKVAERKNRTLIKVARTMLADSKLPTTFWVEAVNTACYLQNRVLLTKPHNKTLYELFLGRKPALGFMRPFGCPITILNTIDHLGKFDGKADEGFFVGYSIKRSGPNWLFDIDALTKSMNYKTIIIGNKYNGNAGTKACADSGKARMETVPGKNYILLPLWPADPLFSQCLKSSLDAGFKPSSDGEMKVDGYPSKEDESNDQEKDDNVDITNNVNTASDGNNTNNVNAVSSTINAAGIEVNVVGAKTSIKLPDDPNMTALEDIIYSDDDEDVGAKVDMNNLDAFMPVSPTLTTRIHKDYPIEKIIRDFNSAPQTRRMTNNLEEHEEPKKVYWNKKDERGIVIKNKVRLVAQGYTHKEGIDYDEVFTPIAKIEAIRLFLAYASFKDFVVYQMDVKSAFLYGKIEEEVYVCQPLGFEDPDFPDRVYKVEKALYGLHQAPRVCQDKYVTEILKKFGFTDVKTANTPMETQKPLLKVEDGEEVDVYLYRSMIGSLMYLTSSRPDIMFAVCAYARYQVNPKVSHLHDVKRIFSMVKNLDNAGKFLMYPRQGKDFFGRVTPLFPTIVVQAQEEMGEDEAVNEDPSMQLKELMDFYTKLQQRVLNLENTKTAQAQEITSLKLRVKRLEKKGVSRTHKLKRLHRVGRSARVVSSDEASLGDQEDASKQGRKIDDIDADAGITLDMAEKEVSIADPVTTAGEVVTTANVEVSTANPTTATITNVELTLAQTLAELKNTRPKTKGVVMQEPSESITTTTTIPSKDKGKADFDEEVRLAREKDKANVALIEEWNDIQAKIDANYQLAQRLQAKEQEKLSIEEKSKLFVQLLENMAGWKPKDLKNKSFANIKQLFDKAMKRVNTFIDMDTELVKGSEVRAEGSETREESSSKRAGYELEQEKVKKQKVDKDKEIAKLQSLYENFDGSSKRYSAFIQMLRNFNREDLETLWKLVKAKHGYTRPEEGYEKVLWGDLKTMFEHHVEDLVWRNLQGNKVLVWKLFDCCGVHFVRFQSLFLSSSQSNSKINKGRIVGIKTLLDDLRVTAAQVFSIWKAFRGNTRDLGPFGEETDKITNQYQDTSRFKVSKPGDGFTIYTRRRHTSSSDGVTTSIDGVSQH